MYRIFHIGCSQGYNISQYPQFSNVNSQGVEQSNALLKHIKSSVSLLYVMHKIS